MLTLLLPTVMLSKLLLTTDGAVNIVAVIVTAKKLFMNVNAVSVLPHKCDVVAVVIDVYTCRNAEMSANSPVDTV